MAPFVKLNFEATCCVYFSRRVLSRIYILKIPSLNFGLIQMGSIEKSSGVVCVAF